MAEASDGNVVGGSETMRQVAHVLRDFLVFQGFALVEYNALRTVLLFAAIQPISQNIQCVLMGYFCPDRPFFQQRVAQPVGGGVYLAVVFPTKAYESPTDGVPGISGYMNITAMILYQYTAIFLADMAY